MDSITPPVNSSIRVESYPDGMKLTWPLPNSWWYHVTTLGLLLCLGLWAYEEYRVIRRVMAGKEEAIWIGLEALIGLVLLSVLWKVLKPMSPEVVELAKDTFTHYPGHPHLNPFSLKTSIDDVSQRENYLQTILKNAKSMTLRRQQITGFILVQTGHRQRLQLLNGTTHIEIGQFLSKEEREWLHMVLEKWRQT